MDQKKKKHRKSTTLLRKIHMLRKEDKVPEEKDNIAIIEPSSVEQLTIRFNRIIEKYDQLQANIGK
jgi:hypothetical protein